MDASGIEEVYKRLKIKDQKYPKMPSCENEEKRVICKSSWREGTVASTNNVSQLLNKK